MAEVEYVQNVLQLIVHLDVYLKDVDWVLWIQT